MEHNVAEEKYTKFHILWDWLVNVQATLYNILKKHKESNSIVVKAQLLQSTQQQNEI